MHPRFFTVVKLLKLMTLIRLPVLLLFDELYRSIFKGLDARQ